MTKYFIDELCQQEAVHNNEISTRCRVIIRDCDPDEYEAVYSNEREAYHIHLVFNNIKIDLRYLDMFKNGFYHAVEDLLGAQHIKTRIAIEFPMLADDNDNDGTVTTKMTIDFGYFRKE